MLLISKNFQLNLPSFQSLLLQRVEHLNLKQKNIYHKLIPGQNTQISNLSRKSLGEDVTIQFLPQVINTLMVPNLSETEMEIEQWKVGGLRNIWEKIALKCFTFRVLMNLQGRYNLPAVCAQDLKHGILSQCPFTQDHRTLTVRGQLTNQEWLCPGKRGIVILCLQMRSSHFCHKKLVK